MTAYRDWIQDFPSRALDLLNRYEQNARDNNLEVTLHVCVGGLLLSAPYERLRMREVDHSQKDRKNLSIDAIEKFDNMMQNSFNNVMTDWSLRSDGWQGGNLRDSDDPSSWDHWKDSEGRNLDDGRAWPLQSISLSTVINTMRNAIAHGQVITYSSGSSQISKLIFLSERYTKDKPLTKNQSALLHEQLLKDLVDEVAVKRVMNAMMQPEETRYRFAGHR